MATENEYFQHESFVIDPESIEHLECPLIGSFWNQVQKDSHLENTLFFSFFDFDDTLHHTTPSLQKYFHQPLYVSALQSLASQFQKEGIHFNLEDPPTHPHMLSFLGALRNAGQSLLVLSAGSAFQLASPDGDTSALPLDHPSLTLTLLTNYQRLFQNAYGICPFSLFGTRCLSPEADRYCSLQALSLPDQIHPKSTLAQETISALFHSIDGAVNDPPRALLSASDLPVEIWNEAQRIVPRVNYFSYRGIIPVSGAKRDALIRYFLHLYLQSPDLFLSPNRMVVYFVDDQPRYLRDVQGYRDSLLLIAAKRSFPEFHTFILSDRFIVKVYQMPSFMISTKSN